MLQCRSMRRAAGRPSPLRVALAAGLVVAATPALAHALIPGPVALTCDVDRAAFQQATRNAKEAIFRFWTSETGAEQLGIDYAVPLDALLVTRVSPPPIGDVRRKPFYRLEAAVGDASTPLDLGSGAVWLDVQVGATTLSCDFGRNRRSAKRPAPPARRRLRNAAFRVPAEGPPGPAGPPGPPAIVQAVQAQGDDWVDVPGDLSEVGAGCALTLETAGGPVLLQGTFVLRLGETDGGHAAFAALSRDGGAAVARRWAAGGQAGETETHTVSLGWLDEAPPAGTHTYELTVGSNGPATVLNPIVPCSLTAIELQPLG